MKSFLFLSIPLAVVACSPAPEESSPTPLAAETSTERAERPTGSPFVLEVQGSPSTEGPHDVELVITIQRKRGRMPLRLRVDLPPGCSIEEGQASEVIPADSERLVTRRLRLRASGIPAEDVRVEVASIPTGGRSGAVARAFHRFGRPEPKLPQPKRGAARKNDRLGAPVELGQRP